MDYKEKYEKALEVAQRFYNNSVAITKKGLEDIFPELKESEDEKILWIKDRLKSLRPQKQWKPSDEQMIKDAIDVEVKVDAGGYPYIDKTIELYDYDKDVPFAKAGEKVKVIIMKEE